MQKKKFYLSILATGVVSFIGVLVETAMNVAFPIIMKEYDVPANLVQWLTTGYLLALAVLVPVSVLLIKMIKPRKLFIMALAFLLIGTLLGAIAQHFYVLIFSRIMQGIGTGITLPLMYHIILTRSPRNKLAIIMGIGGMVTSIAPAFGPSYGGIMLHNFGWKSIFIGIVPLILLSLIVGLFSISNADFKQKSSVKVPLLTVISLTIFIVTLLLFLSDLKLVFALLWLMSFVCLYFTNKRHELIDFSILRDYRYAKLLLAFLLYQMLLLTLAFILPTYIQLKLGFDSMAAGVFMMPGALIGGILAPYSGMLLNKFKNWKIVFIGSLITLIPLLFLTFFISRLSYTLLLICHVVIMIGVGITYTNLMTLSLSQMHSTRIANGTAIINTGQQLSGAIATSVSAKIVSLCVANNSIYGMINGAKISIGLAAFYITIALFLSVMALKLTSQNIK